MTVFLIAAALMTAGALLFVLPGLLRRESHAAPRTQHDELNLSVLRDQLRELDADLSAGTIDGAGYRDARSELERRVAEDVHPVPAPGPAMPQQGRLALVVGLAVPLLAAAMYAYVGNPAGLSPEKAVAAQEQGHELTEAQIVGMVEGLAQRLKSQPDDAEGWSMLARSYNALGRFAEAAEAYARLAKLAPNDSGMLADYADTLAMAQNKSLQGEPERLVARALAADPRNVKAIALSGSAAFERGDFATAATQWQKIMAMVPPESDIARSTAASIGEARERAAKAGTPLPPAPAGQPGTAAAPAAAAAVTGATVSGTVDITPALRARVADTDTVFIFARAVQGPRFPLAVLKKQVKDLPAKFVLDDSMSMVAEAKLSAFPQVVVGARISKSGSATPGPGDFEGLAEPVAPGAKGVAVSIDAQRN